MLLNILLIVLLVTAGSLAFLVWRVWTKYDEINAAYTGLKLNAERLLVENGRLKGVQDRLGKRVRDAEAYELALWMKTADDFDVPMGKRPKADGRRIVDVVRDYRKMSKDAWFGALGYTVVAAAKKHHDVHDIEDVAAQWAAGNTSVTRIP